MPSSDRRRALAFGVALLVASACASRADAQQQPSGFAIDRFYTSAPGGGWFVMDALDMRGGLGGAASMTAGWAKGSLRVTDGSRHLAVVSDLTVSDFGFALTYDRWRLYLDLETPLVAKGQSGTVGDFAFTAPAVDLGSNPDTLSDARIGVDGRLLGGPKDAFRLGAGAQLFTPNGSRADYDTDGTFRGMFRVLLAGDIGAFAYAGHLGAHVRPLNDAPIPGSPRGSELLFGLAAGARVPLCARRSTVVVFGPEIYGESAFQSFLAKSATGVEGLWTMRVEGTADDGAQLRVKLGIGGGLNAHFGAPESRIVFGIELFDHGAANTLSPKSP